MKILIFGASGMVGQGVLRECLQAADVTAITALARAPLPQQHDKLQQRIVADLPQADLSDLRDFDACFYCLGASSSGKSEAQYRALMQALPLSVAEKLRDGNPQLTFVFVTGGGADATSKTIWALVLGESEQRLQLLGLHRVFSFRPMLIQPLHGIRSKQGNYRLFYTLAKPFLGLARRLLPRHILSTEIIGKAMLNAARFGYEKSELEAADIFTLAQR